MADFISTEAAVKLLLLADKNELKALEREGWFSRTATIAGTLLRSFMGASSS